ncbi:MAG: hypothetical protein AAF242_18300, partial [Bacteroidota bacterium]
KREPRISKFDCRVWISMDENKNLILDFLPKSMTTDTFQKHFGSGVFHFCEDFEVPTCILQKIGVREQIRIPRGTWKLKGSKLIIPQIKAVLQAA